MFSLRNPLFSFITIRPYYDGYSHFKKERERERERGREGELNFEIRVVKKCFQFQI